METSDLSGDPMRDLIAVLLDVAMEGSRDGAEAAALAAQCGWAWPGSVRLPDGNGDGNGYGYGTGTGNGNGYGYGNGSGFGYGNGDGGPDA